MSTWPLDALLARLAHNEVRTLAQLAAELEVDAELLEQMLHDLERAGYVHLIQAPCAQACATCDQHKACGLVHSGRIWAVTEKGMRVATRNV